uniref:Uncharacterized protein n=1 Tax=Leptobrachium leishanense TaxID=445787 RepID=A0A8C5PUY7_9ANUR
MASADLRAELTCPICTDIYTDPVTLTCGHNYCQDCITRTWDNQEEREYSCPECRERYRVRPELKRCHVPKSAEHVLTEPTTSLENRKCSVHKKVLEYYCCEDAACICVSCRLDGEHRGHQVETLNEASEKKKEKLRNILQKLTSQREEAEKRVQSLEELRRQVQGKAAGVTERVTALIRDIRKQLEALEKRVLSEISRQEEQVSLREDTERRDIKVHDAGDLDVGLISVTLHSGLAGIVTGITKRRLVLEASDMLLDVNTASDMLLDVNTASDMLLDVNTASDMLLEVNTASDMLLDVNTACNYVSVSEDLKTVSWSGINQRRPETPERFQYRQVLSSRSFSSGRHYWEVEVSESEGWGAGMTYPSIERRGAMQSLIGNNNKSWGLQKFYNKMYSISHDSKFILFPHSFSCHRLGIFLDYEAGRLSFYELCDPIRHLHTFTAAFTEPLHAVFRVCGDNSWVRI